MIYMKYVKYLKICFKTKEIFDFNVLWNFQFIKMRRVHEKFLKYLLSCRRTIRISVLKERYEIVWQTVRCISHFSLKLPTEFWEYFGSLVLCSLGSDKEIQCCVFWSGCLSVFNNKLKLFQYIYLIISTKFLVNILDR